MKQIALTQATERLTMEVTAARGTRKDKHSVETTMTISSMQT